MPDLDIPPAGPVTVPDLDEFTAAIAAADTLWSADHGDPPSEPRYTREVAEMAWTMLARAAVGGSAEADEPDESTIGSQTGECCPMMRDQSTLDCDQHEHPLDCPDVLVLHGPQGPGLPVRDGGASWVAIRYCPWCATDLCAAVPAVASGDDTQPDAWWEALTEQTCAAGIHPLWFTDTEFSHACPWCALAAAGAPAQQDGTRDRIMLLTAEAAHWRQIAEQHEAALRAGGEAVEAALGQTRYLAPPEPPVGTEFRRGDTCEWTRRADGWHCSRADCANCPTDWQEVWERAASGTAVQRTLPALAGAADTDVAKES